MFSWELYHCFDVYLYFSSEQDTYALWLVPRDTGNFVSKNLNVSPGKAEGNTEVWGKQNELFPEGPVFKWFVI